MSVVALVGNGLSISYNQEMSVPSLTTEILHRFENADDELKAIADGIGDGEPPGFEELLGPFDAVSAMIRNLPGIKSGERLSPRFEALGIALDAAREIHSRGTGPALSVIAERSRRGIALAPHRSLAADAVRRGNARKQRTRTTQITSVVAIVGVLVAATLTGWPPSQWAGVSRSLRVKAGRWRQHSASSQCL